MKLHVTAKPKAKKTYVKRIDNFQYIVSVHEPPVAGKANKAIINALSEYFHVPPSCIAIVQGETSRKKVIEIPISANELEKFETEKEFQKKLL